MTIAQRDGMPLLPILVWRYALGTLVLFAVAGAARRAMFGGHALLPVALLGTMQALVAGVSLSALAYIPAATLSFLFYTYPAWIAVIGAVRRTEPLTFPRVAALVLALGGIGIMVGTPGEGAVHPMGIALALVSALLYAAYVPVIEHFERRHGGFAAATWASAGAVLAFLAGAMLLPRLASGPHVPPTAAAWMSVAFLGLVSTAVGFLAFLRGLAVIGPVRAAIVSTVEPFFTAAVAAVVLGQPLTLATFGGGLCVAAAVVLLQRAHENARAELRETLSTDME